MTDNQKSILLKALSFYGAKAQEDIAIEEMAELTKAILKVRRAGEYGQGDIKETIANMIEEVADVEICIEYLKLILETTNPNARVRIDNLRDYKINRLVQRIGEQS